MNCWHKKKIKRSISGEEGMTLVEVLASILLLSLIITVNEATFIAQEQIELLTYYAATKNVEDTLVLLKDESPKMVSGFEVKSTIQNVGGTLYSGTVEVIKEGEVKADAKMETRLVFRAK